MEVMVSQVLMFPKCGTDLLHCLGLGRRSKDGQKMVREMLMFPNRVAFLILNMQIHLLSIQIQMHCL